MTVFSKDTRYGLEQSVYLIQTALEEKLTWLGTINIYGLISNNKDLDGNNIMEWWNGEGKKGGEYKQAFNNDNITSSIGFLELNRDFVNSYAEIDIIFTINLEKAYNQTIRDNERAYLEAKEAIETQHQIQDFKRGIEDVFSGFRTDNIQYLDLQPYDAFSFTVNVPFKDSTCQ